VVIHSRAIVVNHFDANCSLSVLSILLMLICLMCPLAQMYEKSQMLEVSAYLLIPVVVLIECIHQDVAKVCSSEVFQY
jgi:hypothetical protein